jgi:hypothetical protein
MSAVHIGGEIDGSVVTFILRGDLLDPDMVTTALGLSPTKAWKKGDATPATDRYPDLRRAFGMWGLRSALPREVPLDGHLCHLLDQIDRRLSEIGRFRRMGYEAGFSCGCFLERWNRSATLRPSTLARVAALSASLWLDIYCNGGAVDVADDDVET